MALIRDLHSRLFRWAFCKASLRSAVLVLSEAQISCSLPNLAHVVRGGMGQTGICGHGLSRNSDEHEQSDDVVCLCASVCADIWAGHRTPAAAPSTVIGTV